MSEVPNPRASLLPGVSQFEVDFVVPRIGHDLPVGIDPFLLYKSRDPELSDLHARILSVFNRGIGAIRDGDFQVARYLLDFPEPAEIGFGYAKAGKRGSGVGGGLTSLLLRIT